MENQRESLTHGGAGCRRVVLFPVPLQGHINPMLQLAGILHSRGFSIAIIHTRFNSPAASNYPHFTFHPIADGLQETGASTADVVALASLLNATCVSPFRACLGELLSAAGEPVACLITDAAWHFSQSVADSLGIRRIVLRTSSVASFLAFGSLLDRHEHGYFALKQDSQLEEVAELPPLKVKDLPVITTRNTEDLYTYIRAIISQTKASSGIIWNSFQELEPSAIAKLRGDFAVPCFPIGPFHKYFSASSSSLLVQDGSCLPWLNTQAPKSVLYLSFGSIAAMEEQEFMEMASGLESSAQPFLWVVRPGLVRGSEWPGPLPSGFMTRIHGRGRVVKWAPQQEVLGHPAIGGFWTHCGWNSTMESICEGVPMICSPCFGDQKVNARYVKDVWRIGVVIENGAKRGEVEKTIRRLIAEKDGEEMTERAQWLKKKVELCLRQGGSSHRSLESLVSYILSF